MAVIFGSKKPLEEQLGMFDPPEDEVKQFTKKKTKKNQQEITTFAKSTSKKKSNKAEERKEQHQNFKQALGLTDKDIALDFISRAIELIDNVKEELVKLRMQREGQL